MARKAALDCGGKLREVGRKTRVQVVVRRARMVGMSIVL